MSDAPGAARAGTSPRPRPTDTCPASPVPPAAPSRPRRGRWAPAPARDAGRRRAPRASYSCGPAPKTRRKHASIHASAGTTPGSSPPACTRSIRLDSRSYASSVASRTRFSSMCRASVLPGPAPTRYQSSSWGAVSVPLTVARAGICCARWKSFGSCSFTRSGGAGGAGGAGAGGCAAFSRHAQSSAARSRPRRIYLRAALVPGVWVTNSR